MSIYGLTHLRSGEAELTFATALNCLKISKLKIGTFLQSTKPNNDISAMGRFTRNKLHW